MDIQPDYHRLLKAIAHEEPDRVPLAEFQVDTQLMEKFMARPVHNVKDRIEFQTAAGFDFIYLRANYEYPGMSPLVATGTPLSWNYTPEKETESNFEARRVQTLADLENVPWPDPATVDIAHFDTAAQVMPPGMGIITGVGGIFTRTWMLMGYEHFALSLADNPELVARVAAQVGQIQVTVLRRLIQLPRVVAIWYGDDLAYTTGLMASPKVLRKYFFPWIEQLASIAHAASMPFIMHTDGNVRAVLDDLIALGLNALHPVEPKAMDIYELKRRYGQKLALFGNIDLGYTLVAGQGTPEAVRAEVRQRIRDLAPGGGYGLASGAGATRYVALENFNAMREAAFEYGTYPIRL